MAEKRFFLDPVCVLVTGCPISGAGGMVTRRCVPRREGRDLGPVTLDPGILLLLFYYVVL